MKTCLNDSLDRPGRSSLAQEEARELDHNYIGTEHLLLGLLATSDSLASASLTALGYTHDEVQASVEAMIGRGKAPPGGHIPFTPRAKKVLELSLREALQLKHNYIGTEHILLGLLREGEGVAAQILADKHPLDRIRGEAGADRVADRARGSQCGPNTGGARRAHTGCELAGEARSAATTSWRRSSSTRQCRGQGAPTPASTSTSSPQAGRGQHGGHRRRHAGASRRPPARAVRHRRDRDGRAARSRSIELGKQIVQLNGGPLTARGPQLDLLSRLWAAVNGFAATARTLAPRPTYRRRLASSCSVGAYAPGSADVRPADQGVAMDGPDTQSRHRRQSRSRCRLC